MQGHRHDKVGGRQIPAGISDIQQFDQRRRPWQLRSELELMDTGANDPFVKHGGPGRIKMEGGLDAFAAKMFGRGG